MLKKYDCNRGNFLKRAPDKEIITWLSFILLLYTCFKFVFFLSSANPPISAWLVSH
jgi:hypothetical protein